MKRKTTGTNVEMYQAEAVLYGEIRGQLDALAVIKAAGALNVSYTFDFTCLEKQKTAQATLEAALGWADTITLSHLSSWQEELQDALRHWIFDDIYFPGKQDRHWSFERAKNLTGQMWQLIRPTAGWRVQIEAEGYYEAVWDDFVLENESKVFFLHLGVSD